MARRKPSTSSMGNDRTHSTKDTTTNLNGDLQTMEQLSKSQSINTSVSLFNELGNSANEHEAAEPVLKILIQFERLLGSVLHDDYTQRSDGFPELVDKRGFDFVINAFENTGITLTPQLLGLLLDALVKGADTHSATHKSHALESLCEKMGPRILRYF